jgi:DNA-binding transcriptional LysR family regulator
LSTLAPPGPTRVKIAACVREPGYIQLHGAPAPAAEPHARAFLLGTALTLAIQDRRSGKSNRPAAPVAPQQRFCEASIQGLDIFQHPDFYLRNHLRDGTLVKLPADERPSDQTIWAVCFRRDRHNGLESLH